MLRIVLAFVMATAAMGAAAQENASAVYGKDSYGAGTTVSLSAPDTNNVYFAGESVTVGDDISGTAHVAGRNVSISGNVGDDVYAAGMSVRVMGDVRGDATLMGNSVLLSGDLGGSLRSMGSSVTIDGDIDGYAITGGEIVRVNGVVAGDLSVSAANIEFGDNARVDGTLHLYGSDVDGLEIPSSVVTSDRIERHTDAEWADHKEAAGLSVFSWGSFIKGFIQGALLIAVLAALAAGLLPKQMATMRASILQSPFKSIWFGFLSLSVLLGATIVLLISGIAFMLAPIALLLAVLASFIGYIIGAYAVGVAGLKLAGRPVPQETLDRVLAAVIGAVVVALLALLPIIGWFLVVLLTLAGIGGLTIKLLRPGFFVTSS